MSARSADRIAGTVSSRRRPPTLFSCVNLSRSYGTDATAIVAVHDVSCEITAATRVALTGPSGSGKSTLIHLMAGLESPTSGVLSWPALGRNPLGHPDYIGVVFQGPSLIPALDVSENVAFPLLLADVAEPEATDRASAALEQLGIAELAARLPEELSGGQAQRVAVARVLAACPRLILADEPTGQLDRAAAMTVVELLLQAADSLDAALVVSTHDPMISSRLATQWVMRDGRLLVPDLHPGDRASRS